MTAIEHLDKTSPRQEKLLLLCRDQSPIFARAVELYQRHYADETRSPEQPNLALLHALLKKLSLYEAAAWGYGKLAEAALSDAGQNREYARHAQKYALLALVYAFGARKANCQDAARPFDEQTDLFAAGALNRLSALTENDAIQSVYHSLLSSEKRGWRQLTRGSLLLTVMGANWCSDTAALVEIANALEVPVSLRFNEYLQTEEDKGRRKHGILKSHDHATAIYEDLLGKPPIPVVYWPNGIVHSEPRVPAFVEQMVANNMV